MPTRRKRDTDNMEYKYEKCWGGLQGKNFMTFNLRAKEDAHLLLAEYLHVKSNLAHEIRFGELNGMWIRVYHPDGTLCSEHSETGLVDENSYKPFWVSWEEQRIRVGKGLVTGERTLTTCEAATTLSVNAFSIDSGEQNVATWVLSDAKGWWWCWHRSEHLQMDISSVE